MRLPVPVLVLVTQFTGLAEGCKLKLMPFWLNALLFAILVVTIPFTMILRILSQLPRPDALTHRRWPSGVNLVLVGAITAYVTIFIRAAYYVRGSSAVSLFLQFLRSEEHTSELQSLRHLVCRLLLEQKNNF